ncbi:MAG TPA: ABC transporter permease [Leptolyngbyaceae cyanobacterium]
MTRSLAHAPLRKLQLVIPLPLWGVLASMLLWWLATTPALHPSLVLNDFSPERALAATLQLLASGEIVPHIWASLRRVFVGLIAATVLGIPLGLLVGLSRPMEQSTSVLFQFVRMISPLSWMPIAVMAFGIGDMPVYFLLTIAAVWPLMLSTAAGVAAVDRRWLLLSRCLCATWGETISKIVIPAIAPHILTGLRLAIGIIWIVLVPAEMLGVRAGLGYYILDTHDRLAYSELVAVILIIGLIGYLLDAGFRAASRTWHHEG